MTDSDAAVVRRVLAGDTEAFAVLVDRYSDRCARYAVRAVGNREDAEEAVQDAFVRAYRALGDYEDRERFGAWLFRILVNQCRSEVTRGARRAGAFPDVDVAELGTVEDATGDLAERFADRDRLDRALAHLQPEHREALLLRFGEDLSYDEMAALTGSGISALKMRVARAVARLRALLKEAHCV